MNLTIGLKLELYNKQKQPQFKGVLDGAITNTLRVLDTNEMINAVVLDVGPMSLPRAGYDWTHRNKYAGMETLAREIQGTFINCLSAGIFAGIISKLATKYIDPNTKINPNSWFSENSLKTLETAWNNTQDLDKFTETVFNNISGIDGKEVKMQVKAGDKVIYSKYAGTDVKLDGEEYIIVKQGDILAVVE